MWLAVTIWDSTENISIITTMICIKQHCHRVNSVENLGSGAWGLKNMEKRYQESSGTKGINFASWGRVDLSYSTQHCSGNQYGSHGIELLSALKAQRAPHSCPQELTGTFCTKLCLLPDSCCVASRIQLCIWLPKIVPQWLLRELAPLSCLWNVSLLHHLDSHTEESWGKLVLTIMLR